MPSLRGGVAQLIQADEYHQALRMFWDFSWVANVRPVSSHHEDEWDSVFLRSANSGRSLTATQELV